ncbi:MAG: hypothetical protein ACLFOA_05360 [Desulfohalobiaceae bacterium]
MCAAKSPFERRRVQDMPDECPGLSYSLYRAYRCCLCFLAQSLWLSRRSHGFSGADPPIAERLYQEVLP